AGVARTSLPRWGAARGARRLVGGAGGSDRTRPRGLRGGPGLARDRPHAGEPGAGGGTVRGSPRPAERRRVEARGRDCPGAPLAIANAFIDGIPIATSSRACEAAAPPSSQAGRLPGAAQARDDDGDERAQEPAADRSQAARARPRQPTLLLPLK